MRLFILILLIIIIAVIGIASLFIRSIRQMFNVFNSRFNNNKDERKEVIYDKDDVVIMKGEAGQKKIHGKDAETQNKDIEQ